MPLQKSRVTSGSSLSSRASSSAQISSISRTGSTTGRYAEPYFTVSPMAQASAAMARNSLNLFTVYSPKCFFPYYSIHNLI